MVKRFREVMPGADIKRGFQTRGGGKEEADVVAPFLHIECKHQIQPNVRAALRQAQADSEGIDKLPVAIVKDNNKPAFVAMDLEDFLSLVEEWYRLLPVDD